MVRSFLVCSSLLAVSSCDQEDPKCEANRCAYEDECNLVAQVERELANLPDDVRDCGTNDGRNGLDEGEPRAEVNDCVLSAVAEGEAFRSLFMLPSADSTILDAFVGRGDGALPVHLYFDSINSPSLRREACGKVGVRPNCFDDGWPCLVCEDASEGAGLCTAGEP